MQRRWDVGGNSACYLAIIKRSCLFLQDEEGADEEEEESDYQPSDASAINEDNDDYDSEEDYTSEDEEEDESGISWHLLRAFTIKLPIGKWN